MRMNKRDRLYIATLAVIAVACYSHYENDKAAWNLWDDPRGCLISWDDGIYSCKSRERRLGTLAPGESKTVTLEPIDIDANGITFRFTAESWTWTWGGVRGNFIDDKFVPLNEQEAAIAKRLWLNDYGEEWRREGYYAGKDEQRLKAD